MSIFDEGVVLWRGRRKNKGERNSRQDDTCGSVVLLYRLLHEQAPKAFLFTISCPDSMLHHILN